MTTYTIDDVRAMLGRPVLTPPVPKAFTANERAGYEEQIAALRAEVEQLRAELATVTSGQFQQRVADHVLTEVATVLESDDKPAPVEPVTKKARK